MLLKFTNRAEGEACCFSFNLLISCCLFMAAFLMTTGDLFAQQQCLDSPPECQALNDGVSGPNPCFAKMYCSNSASVESGLINCTHAADTDGCGIDASVSAPYSEAILQTTDLFVGSGCTTYDNLQWIVFVTPPTVTGTKIQAVGAADSYFVFYAGSFKIDPNSLDNGDDDDTYRSVFNAVKNRSRCRQFTAADLVLCSDTNQYKSFDGSTSTRFSYDPDAYNVYYIALFYEKPTNGTLNFKVKECKVFECPSFVTTCPDDVNLDSCLSEAQVDTAFGTFLNGFTTGGGITPTVEYFIDGVTNGNVKPTVADLPDDFQCGGSITIKYLLTDSCNIDYECERTFSVLEDNTAPVFDDAPADTSYQCLDDVPAAGNLGYTDNCDDRGEVPGMDVSDGETCPETITRTWSYTDSCGNPASVSQTITVNDDTPAVFNSAPPDATYSCTDVVPAPGMLAYTDNCDGSGEVPGMDVSDGLTNPETITRTWSFTDSCGNPSSVSQIITINACVEKCDTVYGYNPNSQCFLNDGFSQWGWTTPITATPDATTSYTFDLIGGNGNSCDPATGPGTKYGTATVTYTGGTVTVVYNMDGTNILNEAHVYIGCAKYPKTKKGVNTVAPGQYNFNPVLSGGVKTYTVVVNNVSGPVYIIVHGVACTSGVVTAANGGTSTFTTSLACTTPTSTLTKTKVSNVVISPNPFVKEAKVSYSFDYNTKVKIDVMDMSGKVVKSYSNIYYKVGTKGETNLSLSNSLDKMLFVRVSTDKETVVKQLISLNGPEK